MVVSIMWSESSGGSAAMDDVKDWNNIGNGSAAIPLTIYLSHDGNNKISNVAMYIQAYSGPSYTGDATPAADLAEILAWGDAYTGSVPTTLQSGQNFGGFWINMDATGSFADDQWVVHDSGTGVLGSAFPVGVEMGVGTAGEIGPGEEASFKCSIVVPLNEDTAGTRFFDQCLQYTYTS